MTNTTTPRTVAEYSDSSGFYSVTINAESTRLTTVISDYHGDTIESFTLTLTRVPVADTLNSTAYDLTDSFSVCDYPAEVLPELESYESIMWIDGLAYGADWGN